MLNIDRLIYDMDFLYVNEATSFAFDSIVAWVIYNLTYTLYSMRRFEFSFVLLEECKSDDIWFFV